MSSAWREAMVRTDRAPPARTAKKAYSARTHLLMTGLELVVNFAAPLAIFTLERAALGDTRSLMVAAAPPILWSIGRLIFARRLDAISLLVLCGIALSLAAFA